VANRNIRGFSRLGTGVAVFVMLSIALGTAAADHGAAIDEILGATAALVLAAACFFSALGWMLTGFARD
jgi:hypothetical protein